MTTALADSLRAVAGAFFAPLEAFRRLAERPRWVLALLLILTIQIVTTSVNLQHIELEEELRSRLIEQNRSWSEQEVEEAVEVAMTVSRFSGIAGTALTPISLLVIASALMVTCIAFGGKIRLGQAFAATVYAWLPQSLKAMILSLLLLHAGHVPASVSRDMLRSHLGILVDRQEHRALHSVLSAFDVFDVWTLLLLGTGFAAAAKMPIRKTLAIVAGCYGAVVLLRAGIALAQR